MYADAQLSEHGTESSLSSLSQVLSSVAKLLATSVMVSEREGQAEGLPMVLESTVCILAALDKEGQKR